MIRIGQGFDIHRLVEDRDLIIGGVKIPHDKGLYGHSDADVLIHAICDAILGALALGDIGQWFPDNDQAYKNIDSQKLLKEILQSEKVQEWLIINVDTTIFAEKPKFAPHIIDIRKSLATTLNIDIDCISVKAKTMEKLDAVGQRQGISAQAIILLEKRI